MTKKQRLHLDMEINHRYFSGTRLTNKPSGFNKIVISLEWKMRQARHHRYKSKVHEFKAFMHECNFYDWLQLHPKIAPIAY